MKAVALGLVAGPLIVAQGLWVRRVTPRLPEAAGPRTGHWGSGPTLRVLVVGDSSAAGVGASHQDEAHAGRLARALAASRAVRVQWQVCARTGLGAADVLELLAGEPPAEFDIAVTAVGVNDVTGARSAAGWLADMSKLAERLRAHAPHALILASGLPPMHRFPALPQPLRAFLGARARTFDCALARWASTQPRTVHVPLPEMGDPSLAASDGFHPGPGAYAIWADALVAALAALPARGQPSTA